MAWNMNYCVNKCIDMLANIANAISANVSSWIKGAMMISYTINIKNPLVKSIPE